MRVHIAKERKIGELRKEMAGGRPGGGGADLFEVCEERVAARRAAGMAGDEGQEAWKGGRRRRRKEGGD